MEGGRMKREGRRKEREGEGGTLREGRTQKRRWKRKSMKRQASGEA